jgi:hypothetical protein
MDCSLAEGMAFKSGAKVVKNVAGYDLQKLFVGSRGQLFIATLLHLKLRPLPTYRASFSQAGLDQDRAIELFARFRNHARGVIAASMSREGAGFSLALTLEGRTRSNFTLAQAEGFEESSSHDPDVSGIGSEGEELIRGQIRPSKIPVLLSRLPEAAAFTCSGSGEFECSVTRDLSEVLLTDVFVLGGHAEVSQASPERRGICTPRDPGQEMISAGLKSALDPGAVLH